MIYMYKTISVETDIVNFIEIFVNIRNSNFVFMTKIKTLTANLQSFYKSKFALMKLTNRS